MKPPARVIALAALVVGSLTVCVLALFNEWVRPETLQHLVTRSGSLGMLTFVLLVPLAEVLWFPRVWGLLAAGLLFGPVWGVALSLAGDLVGALICFWLARGAGRQWVADLLARHRRADQMVELLARKRGLITMAVLRCCPVAHYTLISYAAGLAGVPTASFLWGTGLGLVPGAVVYTLVGSSLLSPGSPLFLSMLGLVLLALVATPILARRILRDSPGEGR